MEFVVDILLQLSIFPLGLLGLLGGLLGGGGGGAQPIQSNPLPPNEDLGQIPQQLTRNTAAGLTKSLFDAKPSVEDRVEDELRDDEKMQEQQPTPVQPSRQEARESQPDPFAVNTPDQGGLLSGALDAPQQQQNPIKPILQQPEQMSPIAPQQPQQQQPTGTPLATQYSLRRV